MKSALCGLCPPVDLLGAIALIVGAIITMPLGYLLAVLQYETQKELTV